MSATREQLMGVLRREIIRGYVRILEQLYDGKATGRFYYRQGLLRECGDAEAVEELKRLVLWLHSERSLLPASFEFETALEPDANYFVANGTPTRAVAGSTP